MINDLSKPLLAKGLEQHYLLSGDADGAIILWELSLIDGKVHFCSFVFVIGDLSVGSFYLRLLAYLCLICL